MNSFFEWCVEPFCLQVAQFDSDFHKPLFVISSIEEHGSGNSSEKYGSFAYRKSKKTAYQRIGYDHAPADYFEKFYWYFD